MDNIITKQFCVEYIKSNKPRTVGICGVPGAGKSYISSYLLSHFPTAVVIPMDGYHLYRSQLNQYGIERRGAPFTFNLQKFKQDIIRLKNQQTKYPIYFPTFDHKDKDPKENAIEIRFNDSLIIIEGLYIFDKSLMLNQFWDFQIWVQTDNQIATSRLVRRHLESQIVSTESQGLLRAKGSDYENGQYVKKNSIFKKCYIVYNNQ